ncbi:MAG: hypothetical protein WEB09_01740 [Nitriliruptor sp.]
MVALVCSVALLGACDSNDPEPAPISADGDAAPSTEPVSEPEPSEPDDPFAVPDEIDVEYVQRVVDELFRIQGDAYRAAVEADIEPGEPVPTEFLDPLRQISADGEYFARLGALMQQSADAGFADLVDPPADREFEVEELFSAESDCIVASGDVDFTVTAANPDQPTLLHNYVLVPSDRNPTGWAIRTSTAVVEGFEPLEPSEVCP